MATTASARVQDLSRAKSERELRVDTAAAYRLLALFGMDDLLATHISCRLAGEPVRFLINPYGLLFDEITASRLIVLDLDGNVVGDDKTPPNPFGYAIHAAIQGARADARCVIHTHTHPGMAVSALKAGLLPLNQMSMMYYGRVAYYDYEELNVVRDYDKRMTAEKEEQERLVRALGDKDCLIMRNHGLLAVGETMAQAFQRMYYLEQSCRIQMNVLAANADYVLPSPEVAEAVAVQEETDPRPKAQILWEALLRRLDRADPSFRN